MRKIRILSVALLLIMLISLFPTGVGAFDTACGGAYFIDITSDTVLYEKNPKQKMAPGGLTKLVTALVVLENSSPEETVTVTQSALDQAGSSGQVKLKAGEEVSVLDLLHALLMASSNQSAFVLSEYIAGSTDTFVNLMNEKAASIGATDTHFVNPSGLDADGQLTTPYDMALIARYAMNNQRLMEITNRQQYRIQPTNLSDGYNFYTDNHLISRFKHRDYFYKYASGLSFGYTDNAGYCLVSTATKSNRTLVGVLMNGQRENKDDPIPTFRDMGVLFEEAFANYQIQKVLGAGEILGETPVRAGKASDHVSVSAASDIEILLPIDADLAKIEKKLNINEKLGAPLEKGQVIGTVDVLYDGQIMASTDLLANFAVERSLLLYVIDSIGDFFGSIYLKIAFIIILIFVILYLLLLYFANRRRQILLGNIKKRKRRRKF